MDYRTIQSLFTSGIIPPQSSGLVGTDYYNKGLEIAENACFSPNGGVFKRNGTELISRYVDADADDCRPLIVNLKHSRATGYTGEITFVIGKGRILIYNARCSNDYDPDYRAYAVALGTASAFYTETASLSVAVQDEKVYIVSRQYPPRVIECVAVVGPVFTSYYFKLNDVTFVDALTPTLAEGAVKTTAMKFNTSGNYPSIQCFYDGRWFLGGTDNAPTTIWCSRSYDAENGKYRFNDFTLTYFVGAKYTSTDELYWNQVDLADLGCQYRNAGNENTTLSWLYEFQGLILGTSNGIFACTTKSITSSTDNPLNFTRESSIGAYKNLVSSIGNYLVFVGVDDQTVYAMAFSQQYNTFSGAAISLAISQFLSSNASRIYNEHRNAGIIRIATLEGDIPKLFILDYNSGLFCCQFDPANSMVAWSRFTFKNFLPLSIGAMNVNSMTGHNSLRIISGHMSSTSYIEADDKIEFDGYVVMEELENPPIEQLWKYVQLDKYETVTAGTVITGTITPTYLTPYPYNPETTFMVQESAYYYQADKARDQKVVANYDITYPSKLYGTTITSNSSYRYVGEIYNFAICTLRAELPANGTSQGTMRAIKKVVLRLYSSGGGEVYLFPGFDAGWICPPILGDIDNDTEHDESTYPPYIRKPLNFAKVPFYKIFNKTKYDENIKLFTGDVDIQFLTPTIDDDRIAIVQKEPLPFAVCAIIATRAVKES